MAYVFVRPDGIRVRSADGRQCSGHETGQAGGTASAAKAAHTWDPCAPAVPRAGCPARRYARYEGRENCRAIAED
jgi:hypothetical protein